MSTQRHPSCACTSNGRLEDINREPDAVKQLDILPHKILVEGAVIVVDDDLRLGALDMEYFLEHILN
jgi:hypothetical protein